MSHHADYQPSRSPVGHTADLVTCIAWVLVTSVVCISGDGDSGVGWFGGVGVVGGGVYGVRVEDCLHVWALSRLWTVDMHL